MNRQEHLLTLLTEECAEIQQATAKALRFGLKDGYPGTDRTNESDISAELNDLYAIVAMLVEDGLSLHSDISLIEDKKHKVEHYIEYAKQQGTLSS